MPFQMFWKEHFFQLTQSLVWLFSQKLCKSVFEQGSAVRGGMTRVHKGPGARRAPSWAAFVPQTFVWARWKILPLWLLKCLWLPFTYNTLLGSSQLPAHSKSPETVRAASSPDLLRQRAPSVGCSAVPSLASLFVTSLARAVTLLTPACPQQHFVAAVTCASAAAVPSEGET